MVKEPFSMNFVRGCIWFFMAILCMGLIRAAMDRSPGLVLIYAGGLLSGISALLNSHLLSMRHDRLVPTVRGGRYDRRGRLYARLGLVLMLFGLWFQWRSA